MKRTIESVLAQSYSDWELLVVDDQSEDETWKIVSQLAKEDSRIKVFKREHGGVSAGRNFGLSKARGEYVAFIDSDDLWPDFHLEYFYSLVEKYDAGIVSGGFVRFEDGDDDQIFSTFRSFQKLISKNSIKERILRGEQAVEESLYQKGVFSTMWGKLFKKSLFENIKFIEGELYEDLDVFYQVAMRCRTFIESECPMYGYRQRHGSILHTFGRNRLIVLDVTERICKYMERECPALLPAAVDRRFSANFNMLALMLQHDKITKDKDNYYTVKEKECRAYIKKYAKSELFNPRVRIKNKAGALCYLLLPRPLFNLLLIHMA